MAWSRRKVATRTGEETCIGKPEWFHNQLAGHLAMKDFSMRIK